MSENGFNVILRGYENSLRWVLGNQPLTLFVTIATIALSVYLYVIVPKGFFPQQDTGRMGGQILADQATSFRRCGSASSQVLNRGDGRIRPLPASTRMSAAAMDTAARGCRCTLKPLAERQVSSDEVIDAAASEAQRRFPASACSFSRFRICESAGAGVRRSISTRCKATTSRI